jgi:RNA polymerase sigma factor (sigma-70 family)
MSSPTSRVIQDLRRVLLREETGLTDAQLLDRFMENHDDTAFAGLVKRHGPLVWGVCRRVLDQHDAEDAFQATFLVLFRKAASIRHAEKLPSWLHGVARQTALQLRRGITRRRVRERPITHVPEPAMVEHDVWRDVRPLLDQELSRLPEKYRVVVLLCDLEGQTRKEVAQQLGLPEGTIGGRLARARALLTKRLARHGVVLSGAWAGLVSMHAVSAAPPAAVLCSTFATGRMDRTGMISAKVAALAKGVLKTMFLTRLKAVTGILIMALGALAVTCAMLTQAGALGQQALPRTPGEQASKSEPGLNRKPSEEPRKPAQNQAAVYKALFLKTLGVMAEYFEQIDSDEYAGRIGARTPVPPKDRPGMIRVAVAQFRPCDDGTYAIEIIVNNVKEADGEIVCRDADLERVILRRLDVQSRGRVITPQVVAAPITPADSADDAARLLKVAFGESSKALKLPIRMVLRSPHDRVVLAAQALRIQPDGTVTVTSCYLAGFGNSDSQPQVVGTCAEKTMRLRFAAPVGQIANLPNNSLVSLDIDFRALKSED